MFIAIFYVGISVLLLQLYRWQQQLEGRTYPFIALSVLFGLYMVLGSPIPYDAVSIATLAFAIWLVASLLWAESVQSSTELLNWLSYLMLFTASRLLPIDLILWFVFGSGVCFATTQLYRQVFIKHEIKELNLPIFGNSNHNGVFLAMALMAGIWLNSGVDSIAITLLCVVVGLAILATQCKAACIAVFTGLVFLIIATGHYHYFLLLVFVIPLGFLYAGGKNFFKYWADKFKSSYVERRLLYTVAWQIIKSSPIFGYGLNYFKKGMPNAVTKLYGKGWAGKTLSTREHIIYSHRVHNDFLELVIDIGIVGLFLFVFLFTQIHYNPFVIAFLIVFCIDALFFFPFREAHTAIPFWAVMGAAAGFAGGGSVVILKFVGIAVLIAILMSVFKKLCGLVYYTAALFSEKDRDKYLKQALEVDPNNGDYTVLYVTNIFQKEPHNAFYQTMKSIINYDGTRLSWGLWDNLARLFMNSDKFKMAKWAIDESLRLNPNYVEGQKIKAFILNAQEDIAKASQILNQKVTTSRSKNDIK